MGPPPTDVRKLAGSMVKDSLLTYFQAEQFMLGKWRGFTIGKYKLLERIGFGGMGQVFLCEHMYMRRRVAIATVLAMRPRLLVLDEPSANLDPRSRRELLGVLDDVGGTMLVVTHDLPFAAQLCDRAVVLSGGRIVADGPCRDVLADAALLAAHDLELPLGFDLARLMEVAA